MKLPGFDPNLEGAWGKYHRMRQTVRHTVGLLAGQSVTEQLSDHWAVDLKKFVLYWSPISGRSGRPLKDGEALFLTAHEAGHLLYTGDYSWREGVEKNDKDYHFWVNGSEDVRIDRLNAQEYAIYRPLCHEFSRVCIIDELGAEGIGKMSTMFQVVFGMHAIEGGYAKDYTKHLDPQVAQFVADHWQEYSDACKMNTTDEMVGALHPMYLKLKSDLPENPNAEGGGEIPQELLDLLGELLSGLGFDGDGQGDGHGEIQAADRPAKSEVPGGGNPTVVPGGDEDNVDIAARKNGDVPGVQAVKAAKEAGEAEAREFARNATGQSAGTVGETTVSETNYRDVLAPHEGTSRRLARKIAGILRHNAMDAWESGHRRGKLDTRRAKKAMSGNRHIFRKRTAIGSTLYTVAILVDTSGSMQSYGRNMAEVTVSLSDALERAGVNVVVIPWSTKPAFIKRPEDLMGMRGVGNKIAGTISRPSGGTVEVKALDLLEKEFARLRRDGNLGGAIVFSITDGQTNYEAASVDAMGVLEKKYGAKTIGVGLNFRPPNHYQTVETIRDPGHLLEVVPRILKRYIKRGQ